MRMLHFNSKNPVRNQDEESYKVLILDDVTKNIVAPLIRVDELRSHGVTLHMQLVSDRQPIPDVSAVYFVEPTEEVIRRIIEDVTKGVYDTFYLNFSSKLSQLMMEKLANGLVEGNASARVVHVFDQYARFISLDSGLFSLGLPDAYLELNDPQSKDTTIEKNINNIVDGIFCTLATTGVVPVICSPPGGAAEHVARALDQQIRESLKNRMNVFNESTGPGL